MWTPQGRQGSKLLHRPHDVHALEIVGPVLLEDRGVFHRVLVGAGGAVAITWIAVPRRRRIWLIVRHLSAPDHHVMRQHPPGRLVEATGHRFVGHLEVGPGLGPSRSDLAQRPLQVVESDQRRVGLVVGPGPVALDRVGLLRDLPLQLHLGLGGGPRQDHLDARPRRLRVAEVDQPGFRRHPLPGEGAAAGVGGDVGVGLVVVDPRRGDPAVFVAPVALLRFRQCRLVPRVALVDRVPQRVLGHVGLLIGPVVEVGGAEQDADHQVDLDQVGRAELAVDHDAGGDVALLTPVPHVRVVVVDVVGVVEGAPADQVGAPVADVVVPRQLLQEEVVEVVVHRHRALHVVDVAHQPHVVVGAGLMRDVGADPTRHDRRGVCVPAAEQAVHLARVAGHLQRLEVEVAGERVQRAHDVGDRSVAMDLGVRRGGASPRSPAATGSFPAPSARRSRRSPCSR